MPRCSELRRVDEPVLQLVLPGIASKGNWPSKEEEVHVAGRIARRLRDRCDQVVAGPRAAAAGLGAEAAVFVVCGMALALITTGLAGRHAGFDHRAKDGKIRRGLTRHDPSGSGAGVGAIEAKTDVPTIAVMRMTGTPSH